MKKLFTLGMLIGFITMSYGQKLAIYNVTATAEDYVLLLETKGYMAFAFDITSLKDATYWRCKRKIASSTHRFEKNRYFCRDFHELKKHNGRLER